jgi:diguanylate cyclase (GGDEF)-like protein/PAS domain S-box-containing protein
VAEARARAALVTVGRARAALVIAPVVLALLVLLVVGLFHPLLMAPGPGLSGYRRAIAFEGTAVVAVLASAVARAPARLRVSWAALTLMAALWTVTVVGALAGGDDSAWWAVARLLVSGCGLLALLAAPGVRRTAVEWGLVMFDGWLVGASVFVIGWVALTYSGSLFSPATQRTGLVWLPVDLLLASMTAGLAMRSERSTRAPVLLVLLASLLAVTADTTWSLTGELYFPSVEWLVMLYALAGSTLTDELDLWQDTGRSTGSVSPRVLRWSQVAVVPGLVAGLTSPGHPVVVIASVSVVLGVTGQIVLISRQNLQLWATLRAQARRLDGVLRDSGDAILQIDENGVVEFANEAAAEVLGWPAAVLPGLGLIELAHPDDLPELAERGALLYSNSVSVRLSGRFRGQDGAWRCLEATVSRRSGGSPGFTLLARDVSDQVLLQSELRRLASTDPLTGLANRRRFVTLLGERLARGEAAVLFLDLDGFKEVNDLLGHAAGDRLLQEVASALRSTLGPDDVAARLGGDEFAVLAASTDPGTSRVDRDAVESLAARVAERLRRLDSEIGRRTSASVGVAAARGGSADALLGDADVAMYAAKAAGGGRHAMFEPGLRRRFTGRGHVRRPMVAAEAGVRLAFEAALGPARPTPTGVSGPPAAATRPGTAPR